MSAVNNSHDAVSLVPPELPPFLANMFNLKPILGNPSPDEVKVVHEAVRTLNNLLHTPELRNTDLSIELSQHLFDVQMACHRQKYPATVLPTDVVYDPPNLPTYIPIGLKSVTGPPSNAEIASVHAALRISESFANVPSIFDPDLHVQLSQHLFDIQLARHVQRSIMKRAAPATSALQNQTISQSPLGDLNTKFTPRTHISVTAIPQVTESIETQHATLEQPNPPNTDGTHHNPNESNEPHETTDRSIMIEIRDALKNVNRLLVGTQNSLARGFNSSSIQCRPGYGSATSSHNLGAHSLINDRGEIPETYNLPTFALSDTGLPGKVGFSVDTLAENILARYLRFYNIGEEVIEEGEELKIKSDMLDEARRLLSGRLFLNR
ncbi:unnamed protein product [Rhizoctonia solani]|uniref:Laminin domain protein n=1 Tax=Rhizoctonia solani TaxID=456999 RepID=A0A8H3HYI9_9AGAM|nr:unnamed protein product [Rhizoctonia solani]